MAPLATAFEVRLRLDPDTNEFRGRAEGQVTEAANRLGDTGAQAFRGHFLGGLKDIGKQMLALAGAGVALDFFKEAVAGAREAEELGRLTANVIKSTGAAAAVSAEQVEDLAGSLAALTGVDDAVIQRGENLLLTFTNIKNEVGDGNDIFDQATKAALDMSVALGQDMQSSVTQLGKALNDPIAGISALSRVGVAFTDQQKDQIKALVEAGDVMGAQKLILAELTKEFGGAAEAAADPAKKAAFAWGEFQEQIGAALLPVLEKLTTFLGGTLVPIMADQLGPAIEAFGAGWERSAEGAEGFAGRMETLGGILRTVWGFIQTVVIPTARELGTFLLEHPNLIWSVVAAYTAYRAVLIGIAVYQTAVTVAQWAGTVATRAHSAALAVQNAIRTASLSLIATWIGVHAIDLGQWIAKTAAVVAHNVALAAHATWIAVVRAATLTWTVVQAALNVTFLGFPLVWIVLAIGAFVAAIVLAWKHSETFRKIVMGAWEGIKTAAEAVASWFMNTLWPFLRGTIDLVIGYWRFMANAIIGALRLWWEGVQLYWSFIRDKVFSPLRTLITETIPGAFRAGVSAIGKIWAELKQLALSPINFVISVVVNRGIIDTFNKVSGFFHGPTFSHLPTVGDGYGQGRTGDGYGRGSGMGDGLGFGDIMKLIAGPAGWIADKVGLDQITKRFGDSPFTKVLTGMGRGMLDALIARVKEMISRGMDLLRGGSDSGVGLAPGIAAVLAHLRAVFGNVPLISGRRPGDRTLSGAISYHSSGRAIDIAPILAWAQFLNQFYGPQLRELITPWQYLNIHNGRQHNYSGAVWAQHNFAGGNAHIHAALWAGGIIPEPILGVGLSGRRYTFAERGPEHVVPQTSIADLLDGIERLIEAVDRIVPGLGRTMAGASSATLRTARTA